MIPALVFLLMGGVIVQPPQSPAETPEDLFGYWLHSHEERTGELQVYRRENYAFPPSRGREGFQILPDGKFVQYRIAPGDGLDEHLGSWVLAADLRLKITFDDQHPPMQLEVLFVDPQILKLKRLDGE